MHHRGISSVARVPASLETSTRGRLACVRKPTGGCRHALQHRKLGQARQDRARWRMPASNLATIDSDQVRVCLAVARAGQLAGAASLLGLDVSTVSRRLDKLEDELGVHLFDRTRDGTIATAAAEAMLPAAEDMERGLAMFAAARDAIETTAEGLVRMTAPPGIADAFIAPLLARFHQRFPRVVVELDASVGYADLTRREADL